jgi:flagellin
MPAINTNIQSLQAQQSLAINSRKLTQATEQLSTGKRLNHASDDAAGIAISTKMGMQISSMAQAVRNANDATSMLQTVDGAAGGLTNVLMRMRDLAVQSGNDTYSGDGRSALQSEFSLLQEELTRMASDTSWNGMKVAGEDAATMKFHVGASENDSVEVVLKNLNTDGISEAVDAAVTIESGDNARTAIDAIDDSLKNLNTYRAELGASMNRLGHAADNTLNVSGRLSASRSRIQDTDYAKVTTEMARSLIIQQAATAMLTQANRQPAQVLSLLQ